MPKHNSTQKTIFITGGHITPALALIDEMQKSRPDWKIILIGRNILEANFAREKNVDFLPSLAGRQSSFLNVPFGFVQALFYCMRYRPHIIISFGGYVALPVALAGFLLRIPVVTHEQTRGVGVANKIMSKIARKICVTFEDQVDKFPRGKAVVTGLPMREQLFHPPTASPFAIAAGTNNIIYITGGSTGAVSMNKLLFPIIKELVSQYTVVHQTGKPSLADAMTLKEHLDTNVQSRYIVADFYDVSSISWLLHNASLMIGRSGANTVMEAAVFATSMLCIPLPWSGGGEQMENARWLANRGKAQIMPQETITGEKILHMVHRMIKEKEKGNKDIAVRSSDLVHDGARQMHLQISDILGP